MKKSFCAFVIVALWICTSGADCIVSDCSVFCFP